MELYPGAYRIQSLFEDRNLFQYLFVGENVVLLDTGVAATPEKVIFPYLDSLGLKPASLNLAVTTHPDTDHQGGNCAIKRISPGTWLACGEADRPLVEDPRRLYAVRYNFLRAEHAVGFEADPGPEAGMAQKMDLTFSGGEKIRLRDDWALEVLHVPGHSHGHLALYDQKHGAAFVGDALHGRGCPKAQGGMSIPVTYYHVDLYLSTLQHLESLDLQVLHSGHWPTMRGEEIRDFIAESRQTVALFDRAIVRNLVKAPGGLTMKALIDAVSSAVGDWPKETRHFAMFSVKGHMDRLEGQGKVRVVAGSSPVRWQLV